MAKGELKASDIENLVQPKLHRDGHGLYLRVRSATRRSWLFRYMKDGRDHWMGLGPALLGPDSQESKAASLSLNAAREKALELRLMLAKGIDPMAAKKAERAEKAKAEKTRVTFKQAAERYIAAHEKSWKNEKHRAQWTSTLKTYAYTEFGDDDVREIDVAAVLKVIEPLWSRIPETASRLRGRIETVLDYAAARHWRRGENPARWKGHLESVLPAPTKAKKAKRVETGQKGEHFPALPWQQAGAFMVKLRAKRGIGSRALEYTILTAARSNEVFNARWPEVDVEARIWTIPGDKMKGEREHRVALSDAALAVLREMLSLRDTEHGDFIFPGAKAGKPLSNMTMTKIIRDMNEVPVGQPKPWVDPKQANREVVPHGFRSTFRDWVGEATSYPEEIAEAALAHVIRDKAQAAYERGDKLERRRRMMKDWAAFCARPPAEGKVTPIRTAATAVEGT
ncbi:tyrosine-type recombinase/integrase [Mycobacterium sp. KBS0706]|nr:tyrosine-type recombinase/integrase [Mycobacterium sp. KBS0706]